MSDMENMQRLLEGKNKSLSEALAEAEQAAESKSRFLATMSHEIRTPLNGILGLLELVLGTELTPQQYSYLKTIQASGEALLTILNDILDFSKIEAGLMEMKQEPFNPNDLIEHVAKLFLAKVEEKKKVTLITYGIALMPHELMGDAEHLHQILVNLLSNAVKFTEEGEVVLSVEKLAESDTDMRLRFQVRDTGVGIPADAMANLFDEFTQVDSTHQRKHGGTGLGLSIVQRLLGMMGSRIQVSSSYGQGSTFFFDITMPKVAEKRSEGAHCYAEEFSAWKFLLLDEEVHYQGILHHVLSSWGVHCDVCISPEEVLQKLGDSEYDVLMVSQSMLDVLLDDTAYQRMSAGHKLVMLIPNHVQVHMDMREHYGMDAFIRKPVFHRSLCETLLSVMGVVEREKHHVVQQQAACERHEQLLLAEDNKVNQQVAVGMLKNLGFVHVDVVEDGLAAVEQVKRKAYDVILMDIQMPEMDGLTACQEIRALEAMQGLPRTPIIALTAHAMSQDRQISLDAGMDEHMSKPLTGKKLAAMLVKFLPCHDTPIDMPEQAEEEEVAAIRQQGLRQLRQDIGFGIGAIVDAYITNLTDEVDGIHAAITAGDADALRRCAHKLKGGSRSLSADELAKMCYQLELCGEKGDISAALAWMPRFEREVQRVKSALMEDWVETLRT